ncbi:helix-turn-helix transcriptional regulator [Pseudoteredinibacter isoporae]|uniref:AraC-like DNA-binding protein n=1 Tax=Pseudoteredinibacter isoporae TaxID=570281 RepID=A0A7X0JYL1_9GAMM|nr:AraC family transcriptional regulator [Pseudoteredinibacter isoporae]MBB6523641.1 AraC-like DNA-binding protein [Pseudoteredinibacter isoporae]NHO89147.1 helix-turn-helix transcriptional regulator [Pseudoteredinibacter isoporae]NIB22242.1 helix-turn-helix transcriptional regulator [Pseudoteredinibacter isoporae]
MTKAAIATRKFRQNPKASDRNLYLELRLQKSKFKFLESLFYFRDRGELQETSGRLFANHRTQLLFLIHKQECTVHLRRASPTTEARTASKALQLFGITLEHCPYEAQDLIRWPETQTLLRTLPQFPFAKSMDDTLFCGALYEHFEAFLSRLEHTTANQIPARQRRLIEYKRALGNTGAVEQLASHLHIHPRSLQRLCQKVYHTNPKNLMQQLRREQSLHSCLQENESSFDAYCDQAHGIRDFKHHTHFTPKHFARLWQDKTVRFLQSPHPDAELGLLIY